MMVVEQLESVGLEFVRPVFDEQYQDTHDDECEYVPGADFKHDGRCRVENVPDQSDCFTDGRHAEEYPHEIDDEECDGDFDGFA